MGADEGAHALLQALLAAGQEHPDVEVGGRLGVELLGEREHGRHPRGVVVGAGDDLGELDVGEQEGSDHEDQGGGELEDRDQGGVDTGHPDADDRQQEGERPEQDPEGPDGDGEASAEPRPTRDQPGIEGGSGPRGVVVRAEEEARGSVGTASGGDDVLGGATEEQPAEQVDAIVEVQVHRDRGPEHDREADRGLEGGQQAAREPERAVPGVNEPVAGVDVRGLDLGAPPAVAQASREPVRRPPLGVRARRPVLERAQLADHLYSRRGIHERGIIAPVAERR